MAASCEHWNGAILLDVFWRRGWEVSATSLLGFGRDAARTRFRRENKHYSNSIWCCICVGIWSRRFLSECGRTLVSFLQDAGLQQPKRTRSGPNTTKIVFSTRCFLDKTYRNSGLSKPDLTKTVVRRSEALRKQFFFEINIMKIVFFPKWKLWK